MSNGRYVVVKGRFGMGGRIAVMLSAYRYALEADRELIVDWNDYAYYSPGVGDVFQNLFEWPPVSATPLMSLRGATVFPEEWQGKLDDYRNDPHAEIMPYALSFAVPPRVAQPIAADVVVVTRNAKDHRIRGFYPQLRPYRSVRQLIDTHQARFDFTTAIGVQIRHGNGERLLTPPRTDWFHERIAELQARAPERGVFLATDSPAVVEEFGARYRNFYHTEKWYPPIGSGSMHQNADCPDRFQNGVEALVDIFLLARCSSLLVCSGFFGKTARFISGIDDAAVQKFPDKIHPTQADKAGWDNPI
ncbi:MAG TPA: nodulation protein NodZ [Polyangiaceae bacterium]|nr:nodulation protein NodZ [Polyangiaceae bacterium]